MGLENTPPASPGVGGLDDDDQIYDDEIAEEIDVGEGVMEDDMEEEDEEEELVELPGGVDQLEALLEEEEQRVADNSKLVFDKHNGSVFCCDLGGNADLVVTGGEDDRALIWRLEDGKVEEEVAGWSDSVTCAAWSKDGGLLALADMAGSLRVLRCPGYEQVWTFEVGDLVWMKWHPVANVLFAGTEDSQLWMFKIPGGESKVFPGAGDRVECGEIIGEGRKAVCGYAEGSIRLFDLRSGETLHSLTGGHKDSVNCVAALQGRDLLLSGGRDGVVALWNAGSGKQVGTLICGDKQEENSGHSVESVVVPADKTANIAVTGTLGGTVAAWDLSTQIVRTSMKVGEGVTCLAMGGDQVVYCGTLDGAIRSVDMRTGNAVAEYGGHKGSVLDLRLDVEKGLLLTAGDDGTARVYDIGGPS